MGRVFTVDMIKLIWLSFVRESAGILKNDCLKFYKWIVHVNAVCYLFEEKILTNK